MEEQKLPKRPEAHVTGDRAVTVFKFYRRPEWVVNEVKSDYGFDLIITTEHEGYVQNLLLAQLKGSDSPDYSADGKYISVDQGVKSNPSLSLDDKISCLATIASSFPQDDKIRIEQRLVKEIRNL